MALPWPTFESWYLIPEDDRESFTELVSELLSHGAILGDNGRERNLYMLGKRYFSQVQDYLSLLQLQLIDESDHSILQIRPDPSTCSLTINFNKAETLLILTLWRVYHDSQVQNNSRIITANDLDKRFELYFEKITPPKSNHLADMLKKLKRKRLINLEWIDSRVGESKIEVLPTLHRIIPFQNVEEWNQEVKTWQISEESDVNNEPAN